MEIPKKGQQIYVATQLYLSRGSEDVIGGLATVTKVTQDIVAGKKTIFISVKEHPGHNYNWEILSERQKSLKKEFGEKKAYESPDEDRPFIENGDIVNGKKYCGPPIW